MDNSAELIKKIEARFKLQEWQKMLVQDYCAGEIDKDGFDKAENDWSKTKVFKLIKEVEGERD